MVNVTYCFHNLAMPHGKVEEKILLGENKRQKKKLETLKLQSDLFNSKITIPFASFIYFSNNLNYYLNDSINKPQKICEEFIDKENKLIFLQPYQIIKLQDLDNTKNNFNFWQNKFLNINEKKIISFNSQNTFEDLQKSFVKYYERLLERNSKLMIKIIKLVPFINAFQPIVINFIDLNCNVYIDFANKIFKKTDNDAEILMNSRSMNLIFLQDFGFDTLTINGCFEELKKDSF